MSLILMSKRHGLFLNFIECKERTCQAALKEQTWKDKRTKSLRCAEIVLLNWPSQHILSNRPHPMHNKLCKWACIVNATYALSMLMFFLIWQYNFSRHDSGLNRFFFKWSQTKLQRFTFTSCHIFASLQREYIKSEQENFKAHRLLYVVHRNDFWDFDINVGFLSLKSMYPQYQESEYFYASSWVLEYWN